MTGNLDMPSWGMDAVTKQPLTQEALGNTGTPAAAPAAEASSGLTAADVEAMLNAAGGAKEEYIPTGQFDIDVKMADLIARNQVSVADANKATESMRSAQGGNVNSWGGSNAATSGGNNSLWG